MGKPGTEWAITRNIQKEKKNDTFVPKLILVLCSLRIRCYRGDS